MAIYSMSSTGDMQAPCELPGAVGAVLETTHVHCIQAYDI